MTGMHQPCGEYVSADEILKLQLWADDIKEVLDVRTRQNAIMREALLLIATRFAGQHSSSIARGALKDVGLIAPSTENVINLPSNVIKFKGSP